MVADAQPLGDRPVKVVAAQPQLVGNRLRMSIQIGEMVAPALHRGAHQRPRIVIRHRRAGAVARHPVERARERLRPAGCRRQPFGDLVAVDLQIGEQRIGQPPPQRIGAAARLGGGERARIEIKPLRQPHQQPRRHRPLIALDQVEIAGADAQRFRHRRLRQSRPPPRAPDRMTRQQLAFRHVLQPPIRARYGHDRYLGCEDFTI